MNQFIKWLQAHPDVRVTFDLFFGHLRITMQDPEKHKFVSRLVEMKEVSILLVDFECYLVTILDKLYSKLK